MEYPPKPAGISEAAWRYLCDLRSLPFDEFRAKHERKLNDYAKR